MIYEVEKFAETTSNENLNGVYGCKCTSLFSISFSATYIIYFRGNIN